MLLIFEVETGIASACVLSSGILILLVVVIHSLVKASKTAKSYHSDLDTVYQNDRGSSNAAVSRPCELKVGVDKPRMHRSQSHLQHQLSYPQCGVARQREPFEQQQFSPAAGSQGHMSDKDGYSSGGSGTRIHRTLSTESGLLQAQAKPWNGVNNEMRSVLARKSGISAKDSTLVWQRPCLQFKELIILKRLKELLSSFVSIRCKTAVLFYTDWTDWKTWTWIFTFINWFVLLRWLSWQKHIDATAV